MSIEEQLQAISDGIDEDYKTRFISKTQRLLDGGINETHTFLDASLTFHNGKATWKQDLPIIDAKKSKSPTNPLRNPKIQVQSAEHSYDLFKEYYNCALLHKKDAYEKGKSDLERYCKN